MDSLLSLVFLRQLVEFHAYLRTSEFFKPFSGLGCGAAVLIQLSRYCAFGKGVHQFHEHERIPELRND